jgi:23S rRNA-intervening sequence protein
MPIEAVRDYKDLLVWQRAMELAEMVYRLTRVFPNEEIWNHFANAACRNLCPIQCC